MDSTMHPTEELCLAEKPETPRALAEAVVTILDRKKAREIKLLHVEKKTVIADYFVLATGTSRTQIRALADEVEYQLSLVGLHPSHKEGAESGVWVLLDYDSVIVHLFNREARDFYKLDKLYEDASEEDIHALLSEE